MPLFPQYCGASTGAVYDQVNAELRRWRWLPELRFIAEYHDHPGYIEALRASVAQHWQTHGRTEQLLVSFHGIPERYFQRGDPYFCKCQKTARLLAEELMLRDEQWSVSFHPDSAPHAGLRLIRPMSSPQMPARGIDEVTVICPGFAIDCLETLEEIAIENRERFHRGGRPALPLCARAQCPPRACPRTCGSDRAALPRLDAVRARPVSRRRGARRLGIKTPRACSAAFTRSASSTADIRASVDFYERLGFSQAQTGDTWPHPYGVSRTAAFSSGCTRAH